jgi:hypothetical protein
MPTNPGQAALQRGDARTFSALSKPVGTGGEIEPDGLRIGRQLRKTLAAQPGGEMPPIGVVGALGVVGASGAGVVFGGLGERGEATVWRAAGRGQGVFVGLGSVFVRIFPTARRCRSRLLSGLLSI